MRSLLATLVLLVLVPALRSDDPPCSKIDLSGRWSGYWISDKNGHKGPLHANFHKVGPNCYRVTFRGRFWVVLPFIYGTNLTVTGESPEAVTLAGATVLGPVMGTFRYDATATPCHFEARFTSKGDCGRFVLDRDAK